jgi:hypothetical protein
MGKFVLIVNYEGLGRWYTVLQITEFQNLIVLSSRNFLKTEPTALLPDNMKKYYRISYFTS